MTHFKTENGASVQFCSQSNLVILPSSGRWWCYAGEHGPDYLMASRGGEGAVYWWRNILSILMHAVETNRKQ